jgi:hypothetical protein
MSPTRLLGAAATAVLPLAAAACVFSASVLMPESSDGQGGAGGTDTTTSASGAGGGGDAGGSVTASSSSGGTSVKLTCDDYCTQIQKNCTGDNAQWGGPAPLASCMVACSTWLPGALTDTMGNTLGCRLYHSGMPAMMTPAMHCGHAGLLGGDLDPTASGIGKDGPCGDGVAAFCRLVIANCKGASTVWADEAACKIDASKFKVSTHPFSATVDTAGDTFNCRAYHLTVAVSSAANATTHCPHISLVSATCN